MWRPVRRDSVSPQNLGTSHPGVLLYDGEVRGTPMACYDLQLSKMEETIKVSWRCPKCMKRNKWKWERWDLHAGPIKMHCDECHQETAMYQDNVGNFCCIENIEEMLTVPMAKKFLAKFGYEAQQRFGTM